MLLLDPAAEAALAVDRRLPESAERVRAALGARWPRLREQVTLEEASITDVALREGDVVVSCHACGALTDRVLDAAIAARAPVAVLPCCQAEATGDQGGLDGWMDSALAIDATRALRLRASGYRVTTQVIPEAMTAKNRLLIGVVPGSAPG
jgi:hypothetical protein